LEAGHVIGPDFHNGGEEAGEGDDFESFGREFSRGFEERAIFIVNVENQLHGFGLRFDAEIIEADSCWFGIRVVVVMNAKP
jgi:hypothetical protein